MPFFQRLAIAGASVVYGLKKYPLHGPFPNSFGANNNNTIIIHMDSSFSFNANQTKVTSGFHLCCDLSKDICDQWGHKWVPIAKEHVVFDPTKRIIKATISRKDCKLPKSHILLRPEWLAYAWENAPVKTNFGAVVYGIDEFKLPAPVWRCKLQWANFHRVVGCNWEKKWVVDNAYVIKKDPNCCLEFYVR